MRVFGLSGRAGVPHVHVRLGLRTQDPHTGLATSPDPPSLSANHRFARCALWEALVSTASRPHAARTERPLQPTH